MVKIKKAIENVLHQNGYTLDSVFLFGSRARGDFEKESDFDILVIVKNIIDTRQKREIWHKIYHQLHREFPSTPFDVIVKTAMDFENEKDIVNTISNEAYIDGIRI